MMKIEKYGTLDEANLKIQGGITGGVPTSQPFVGLVGNTITFAAPAGACTFTQPTSAVVGQMAFKDVKAQLEAAVANLVVSSINDKLCFKHATAGSAVSLAALDEPARVALGLVNDEAIAGRCLGGPSAAAPPRFIGFVADSPFVYIAIEV